MMVRAVRAVVIWMVRAVRAVRAVVVRAVRAVPKKGFAQNGHVSAIPLVGAELLIKKHPGAPERVETTIPAPLLTPTNLEASSRPQLYSSGDDSVVGGAMVLSTLSECHPRGRRWLSHYGS